MQNFVLVFRSRLARIGVHNPFVNRELLGPFISVSQVNLFKFMAIGRQTHKNVNLNFR